ncbi:hypothetical protein D3C73_1411250 [compost metagenome]
MNGLLRLILHLTVNQLLDIIVGKTELICIIWQNHAFGFNHGPFRIDLPGLLISNAGYQIRVEGASRASRNLEQLLSSARETPQPVLDQIIDGIARFLPDNLS